MRRGFRAGWIVAAPVVVWGSGAPASAQEGDVGVALDRAYERFSQAYQDGDPAAVAALYADDAFYLAPGRDMTRGDVARHFEWLSSFEPGSGPRIEFDRRPGCGGGPGVRHRVLRDRTGGRPRG